MAGLIISIREKYPNQPLEYEGHSLSGQMFCHTVDILEKLGYTVENNNALIDSVVLFQPAVDNETFCNGAAFADDMQSTVRNKIYATYSAYDDAELGYVFHNFYTLSWDWGYLENGPQSDLQWNKDKFVPVNLTPRPEVQPNGTIIITTDWGPNALMYSHYSFYEDSYNTEKGIWQYTKEKIYDVDISYYGSKK
jgi:hypothetical protein